jgi:UDPglucose 6-dehydrogenase
MKIGIVGLGVVGSACRHGFELIGHIVNVHDIAMDTSLSDLLDTEIIYVCVPTPENTDGSCNIDAVEQTVAELSKLNYQGVIALKSTAAPGTTQRLIDKYQLRICFVPEFLRERCAVEDFVNNHELLAVGTDDPEIYEIVVKSHGMLPKHTSMLNSTEAEVLKYFSNVFNAVRVVFSNNMFEICKSLGLDYDKIKDTYLLRKTASPDYMDVSEELRGYGGMCLPKDTKALDALVKQLGLDLKLFETIDKDNQQFKRTVFPGMRD